MGLIVRNINFTGNFRGTFPQVPPPPPPPPAPSDQYGAYTVLDLPGTGTNNTNNSVFVDSSSNNFTITRYGNTTQGSFSPFSTAPGYWSNYFDGSGDYLTVPNNSAFDITASSFTLEAWVYRTTSNAIHYIFSHRPALGSEGWEFRINSDNTLQVFYTGVGNSIISTATVTANQWVHVAATRTGTTGKLFINGTEVASGTMNNGVSTNATLKIGADNTLSGNFQGYISNARIVKGTALYTTNFTPPTTPLTAVSGTSLLTCQSNRFIDNSSNNFAITRVGDTSVSAFGPYAPASSYNAATMGGSIYFDGSGDYLTVPDNSAFTFGTDDFTVEAYCYITSSASGTITYLSGNNSSYAAVRIGISLGQVYVLMSKSGSSWDVQSGLVGPNLISQWAHIAVTRSSSTVRLFVNGTQVGTNYSISGSLMNFSNNVVGWFPGYVEYFPGFISNLRVVKGTAVYTSNFTPPAAPVSAISGTSLLLNGTNAAIVDASTKNTLETVGDAKVSTTVSANGSMYFDGNGDYLLAPSNDTQQLGAGNFTIEMWIKSSTGGALFTKDNNEFVNWGNLFLSAGSTVIFFCNPDPNSASGRVNLNSTSSVITNNWVHIAVSRTGNNWYLFVNGILEATASSSVGFWNTSSPFYVGCTLLRSSPAGFYQGYINNLRVTKGIGRYTANFTPPARS